jgi:predicted RND superfamily exporter protein
MTEEKRKRDIWEIVEKKVRKMLTKNESVQLTELIKDYGGFDEVMIMALRKFINPDILTSADMELCLRKALQINAYLNAVSPTQTNNNPYDMSRYEKMADEIYENAIKSSTPEQQNNPFANLIKEYLNGITQALYNDMMSKLKQSLPQPQVQPKVVEQKQNDEVFKGDDA